MFLNFVRVTSRFSCRSPDAERVLFPSARPLFTLKGPSCSLHMSTTSPRINTELLQEPQLDSWGCWPVLCVFLGPRKLWNYCCFEFISTRIKKNIPTHEILHCILNTGRSSWKTSLFFIYRQIDVYFVMPQNVVIWEILISWLTGVFLKFNALYLRIAWCVADTGRVVIRLTALLWIMCAFFFLDFGGKFHARKRGYNFTTNWIRVIESVFTLFHICAFCRLFFCTF